MGLIVGALLLGVGYLGGQSGRRPNLRVGQAVLALIGAAGTVWTGAGVFSILT
jgi:hypothetical protein